MIDYTFTYYLQKASDYAKSNSHEYITTMHLLYIILKYDEGLRNFIKNECKNTNLNDLITHIEVITKANPKVSSNLAPTLSYSLEIILNKANNSNINFDAMQFFKTLLEDKEGDCAKVLNYHNIFNFNENLENETKDDKKENLLSLYTSNLNELAKNGKIDPLIGRQKEITQTMQTLCRRKKNNPILVGEAGVGKTAIVEGIALKIVNGEVPNKLKNKTIYALNSADLVAGTKYRGDFEERLKNIMDELKKDKDAILFIDEIHRLNSTVEEILYPAMEDFRLDIIIGSGPAAQTIKIDIPKFTLIGATTKAGMISAPLRDRFGISFRLEFYSPDELASITQKASLKLNKSIDKDASLEIAKRSRGTPRIALRLLKRIRDFADINDEENISLNRAKTSLDELGVNELGFDELDLKYLGILFEANKKPLGLNTISAALSEDEGTIEDVIEPYLLANSYIQRTAKGRIATYKSYEMLKIPYQKGLFDEDE